MTKPRAGEVLSLVRGFVVLTTSFVPAPLSRGWPNPPDEAGRPLVPLCPQAGHHAVDVGLGTVLADLDLASMPVDGKLDADDGAQLAGVEARRGVDTIRMRAPASCWSVEPTDVFGDPGGVVADHELPYTWAVT